MIFDFYPWKMDVDVEATKQFYIENDFAKEREVNAKFYENMSEKQKNFFISLGVNAEKIEIEEKMYDIPEENDMPRAKIHICSIKFLVCGKMLSLPDYQKEIYGDEEVFGETFSNTITVVEMPEGEKLPVFDVDGMGCVFKHPYFHFDKEVFKQWDCGYVLGTILIMKDL